MSSKGNKLLAKIRNGENMTDGDKLRLIMQLSIPSILSVWMTPARGWMVY